MNCMSLTSNDWDQTGFCWCKDKGRMRWGTGLRSCFSLIGLKNQNVSRMCWEMYDKIVRTFFFLFSLLLQWHESLSRQDIGGARSWSKQMSDFILLIPLPRWRFRVHLFICSFVCWKAPPLGNGANLNWQHPSKLKFLMVARDKKENPIHFSRKYSRVWQAKCCFQLWWMKGNSACVLWW